ncbi:O-antigen translocase [Thiopseudomonas alkaliphila]|uniref:O-antigen translocase n=1 Tax=Thiopseudomonas alkaliphila TaxID=1697053 RepID=UPI00069F5FF6|nr:O-antigen translocase [Thiopseudomonas alkaliphila]AKX50704.1 polysaccharide biosynthesis protein [Thiopseudomonas alkaliphila]AKX57039.1 polysaccharide biosynthesis protein [Thiopseudomonas alkaliphila]
MTLIKTSLLNAIAVVIKMATMLGLNKILAIYVGPAGYAAIGNFQNAVQMITTFGSGAINTGVVKYTAEYYDDEKKQRQVWRTAGTIAVLGSVITGIGVAVFSKQIAHWFLQDESYHTVFIWFSVTLIFFIFNTLLLAILNGKKEIHRYIIANIAGSLFSLAVTSILAIQFGLLGALTALVIFPSFAFVVTLCLCYKANWFKFSYLFGRLDKQVVLNLSKYTAMALTSAACVPVSHILVRSHLADTLGLEVAGYWEAMWRLSGAYLMLVTTTLSIYYLPRLSELKEPSSIKKEILQGYKIILPVAAFCGLIIYLLRDFIIGVLFTNDFSAMRDLFAWQMVGDTLKIGSWILAYLMLGKAMMKLFIASEIVFAAGFYGWTYFLTGMYGLEGVTIAHAINYAIYWVVMGVFIFKFLVGIEKPANGTAL